MTVVRFEAHGDPVGQGSLRAFVANGRAHVTYGPRATALGTWRGVVGAAAIDAMADREPVAGSVVVEARFTFARPVSHQGARGVLPRFAAAVPGPDIDKLARAVLDALTGIVYRDDRQVRDLLATKAYGEVPGVVVAVATVDPAGTLVDGVSTPEPLWPDPLTTETPSPKGAQRWRPSP
jgi:crossover junction endodeoxyribonuclease RusA